MLQLFIKTAGATAIVWQPFTQKVTNLKLDWSRYVNNEPKKWSGCPWLFFWYGRTRTVPYHRNSSYYTRIVKLVVSQTSTHFFTMMILFRHYNNRVYHRCYSSLESEETIVFKPIIDFVFGLDIEPYGVFHMVESIFVPNAGHAFLKQTFSSLLTPSQT